MPYKIIITKNKLFSDARISYRSYSTPICDSSHTDETESHDRLDFRGFPQPLQTPVVNIALN
jgi:hypothetical protein